MLRAKQFGFIHLRTEMPDERPTMPTRLGCHGTRYTVRTAPRLARTDVHTVADQLPCATDTYGIQEAGTHT